MFMDIDAIPPGTDFREYITRSLDRCDVMRVLIGLLPPLLGVRAIAAGAVPGLTGWMAWPPLYYEVPIALGLIQLSISGWLSLYRALGGS